ncbi:DnaJ domain [Pseudocohnilembus persalinus]|uniref:DnaJ domain n=1 Tax=Pseudocohnilembus persalinus TaxID=266149 RepID=A0A0V0QUR1_PSEPJ|nr:DnaJ domain [Pseudocohnilembus persalinus]|eukprot:KRX06018.1 DnaJ domain [Pseudocohnilembus persalinus]
MDLQIQGRDQQVKEKFNSNLFNDITNNFNNLTLKNGNKQTPKILKQIINNQPTHKRKNSQQLTHVRSVSLAIANQNRRQTAALINVDALPQKLQQENEIEINNSEKVQQNIQQEGNYLKTQKEEKIQINNSKKQNSLQQEQNYRILIKQKGYMQCKKLEDQLDKFRLKDETIIEHKQFQQAIQNEINFLDLSLQKSMFVGEIYQQMRMDDMQWLEKQNDFQDLKQKFNNENVIQYRQVIVTWFLDVYLSNRKGIDFDTYILFVQILDIYLQKCKMSIEDEVQFQKIGGMALFISLKYSQFEVNQTLKHWQQTLTISPKVLGQIEQDILKAIDYDITFPLVTNFIKRLNILLQIPDFIQKISQYILMICLVNQDLFTWPSSFIGACCVYYSWKMAHIISFQEINKKEKILQIELNQFEIEQKELAQYSNQKDKNWNQENNDINIQNDYIVNQQKNNHDVYDVSPKNTPVQSQNSNEDEIQADDWGLGENQAEQNNQSTHQQNFQKSNNSTSNMHQGGDLWGDEPQQQSGHSILSNQSNSNSQQYQFDSTESGNFVIINGQKVSREELQKQKLDLIEKNKNDKIKDLQDSIQGEKDKKNKRLEMGPIWKEKVNAWAYKDKQRQNIRKLLASVHEILWKDCDWTPLQLHDLLDDNSVKKAYYKSLLKIHPDKNRGKGAEIEYLAESIIHEIKEGWDEYKNNNN